MSHELGKLVEECGCDIEGAKIEVWVEVGIFVVELIALAVAVILTLGAASPAAAAAIAGEPVRHPADLPEADRAAGQEDREEGGQGGR